MKNPFRSGFAHRRPILVALLVVTIVAVPGYWRLEHSIDEAHSAADTAEATATALAAFVVDQAETTCREREDFREILRRLVELTDDGTGLNLTAIPSFAGLPESVKTYLLDLERRSQESPEPSRFVEDALELLETVACPDAADLEEESRP